MKKIDVVWNNMKENNEGNILKRNYVKKLTIWGELDDTGNERTTYFNFLAVDLNDNRQSTAIEEGRGKKVLYQRGISNKDRDCRYIHYKRDEDKDKKFSLDIRPFLNDDSEDVKLISRRLQKYIINAIRSDVFQHNDISFNEDFKSELELFCDVILEKYYLSRLKGE
jgi:hypothetical protein